MDATNSFVDIFPCAYTYLTGEQLSEGVWGEEFVGETSSLPVFIRKIREKIEKDPSHPEYLQTAWRSGYRFGS